MIIEDPMKPAFQPAPRHSVTPNHEMLPSTLATSRTPDRQETDRHLQEVHLRLLEEHCAIRHLQAETYLQCTSPGLTATAEAGGCRHHQEVTASHHRREEGREVLSSIILEVSEDPEAPIRFGITIRTMSWMDW